MEHQILLIQEDQANADAIRDALAKSHDSLFEVEWVRRCSEGLEHFSKEDDTFISENRTIHAVLLDLFLPDSSGIETFDKIFGLAPRVPILVLTTAQNEDVAKLAVQRGAQDYLLKGHLDPYLLPKVLSNMIERAANTEALFDEKERAQVTLNSIGDAVMSTDFRGRITFLNIVAERLTGWARDEALGR